MKKYIPKACQLSSVESGECIINEYANCTENSECLSNKCFNRFCLFNDEKTNCAL